MPNPIPNPATLPNLETRYQTQKVGGAFDVKKVLGAPGISPAAGTIINATSMQGDNFQFPDGFEVKVKPEITQLKDAQGTMSKQLSIYMKGFSNQKYHP
jgi:hypothetical protein